MSKTLKLLERLEAALADKAPELLAQLKPGADEKAIAKLKKAVGVELPESFYDWYRWRNGSSDEIRPLDGHVWLDTEGVASNKKMMDSIIDDGHYANWQDDEWWSKSWVAFSDDGSGYGALVIDQNGSFGGKRGQVMWAAAKEYDRILQAKDFDSWLRYLVAVFEQGCFSVEEGDYLFEAHALHKKMCRGYPKAFEPSEAAAPASEDELQAPTQQGWPDGVDEQAKWLVQPSGDKVKHWLIALRRTAVVTWSGRRANKLKETLNKHKKGDVARTEHDKALRKRIKSGFSYVRSAEGARRGDCLLLMQTGSNYVSLAGDGRTLAYGKTTKQAQGAELYLADAMTARRRLLCSETGEPQYFVHMVDFDADDRPVWMVNGATSRFDGKSKVLANIRQPGKVEPFNPHVSRSAFDASGQRLLTFHKTGIRVLEGNKILFRHRVKRGKCEYRYAGISPSGKRVAIIYRSRFVIYSHEDAKDDKTDEIRIFDVDGGELIAQLPRPKKLGYVHRIGISPDDRYVLVNDYQTLYALDIETGKQAWKRGEVRQWAYSPDGKLLAVAQRASVELLNSKTRRKLATFGEGSPWAESWGEIHETERLAFSRDGSRLLQVCGGRVYLWKV